MGFLANAYAYYCSLGVRPKRMLTDNRSPPVQRASVGFAKAWNRSIALPSPTGHEPMGRPSASSVRAA